MVAPARIEGLLAMQPEIAQAMVYGDRRPHLVAVIVPHQETIECRREGERRVTPISRRSPTTRRCARPSTRRSRA